MSNTHIADYFDVYFHFQVVQVLAPILILKVKLMEVQMMQYGKNVSSHCKINWYSTSVTNIFKNATIEFQNVTPFLATILLSYLASYQPVQRILTGTFALKMNMPCFMVWSIALELLLV